MPQEYPKMVFHPDGRQARVSNPAEEAEYIAAGWTVAQVTSASGVSRIPATIVSTTLVTAKPKLRTLKFVNDSPHILRILYGDGATAAHYTWVLDPGERWEMPSTVEQGTTKPEYAGLITGIWESAVGYCQVTLTEFP